MALIKTPNLTNIFSVQDTIRKLLQHEFGFDIESRITVIDDVNHYTKDDMGVWEQIQGKRDNYYEIYWDNVWICDFTERTPLKTIRLNFLKGFAESYEKDKIGIRTPKEIETDRSEKMIQKAIDEVNAKKINNEGDQIEKEVILGLLEDKKPSNRRKAKK